MPSSRKQTPSIEQTPSAWKEGNVNYVSGLTLDMAKKMLEAAEKEAKKRGVPMVVAIVDSGGNLVALHRMDNAMLCSVQIAMNKAFTAVFGKLPTQAWHGVFASGELPHLFFHDRWIAFGGGFPLVRNKKLLGGLGSSGGTIEDLYVAKAALVAGGFGTDDVDAALAEAQQV